jgi:hypothetical protein
MNASRLLLLMILLSVFVLDTDATIAARYHIDSQDGSDQNSGLNVTAAWQSHTKVQEVDLLPGDVVMFKCGSEFSGPIHITESGTEEKPIILTAYGEGDAPKFTNPDDLDMNGNCIRISGSYVIVENLHFHDTPPTERSDRLTSIFQMGAVFNMHSAKHNIIRCNTFTKCTKGIQSTGEFTLITQNTMDGPNHALWMRPEVFDADAIIQGRADIQGRTTFNGSVGIKRGAWGPIGIQLGIGNQEVSHNTIKNYLTLDSPYGSDGGAIELDDGRYHKRNVYIHHNYAEGNAGFFESSWKADYNPMVQEVDNLRVAFNVSYDGQSFVYLHAPCVNTVFDNNTVIRTNSFGSPMYDIVYSAFPGIQFRNNLYVGTDQCFQGGPYKKAGRVNAHNNWFWNIDSPQESDGDPLLLDIQGKDFRPRSDSPLRDKGLNLSEHYESDFTGSPLPETGAWNVGAY